MADAAFLLDILESPLKEVLSSDIYVEPEDKDIDSEDDRQIAFVNTMKRDHSHVIVHWVRNSGYTDWQRTHAQRMGQYAGWPDLGVDWNGGDARIEFKDGDGYPQPHQIACLNRLHRTGKHVAVCRTAKGAVAWLRSVGAPL